MFAQKSRQSPLRPLPEMRSGEGVGRRTGERRLRSKYYGEFDAFKETIDSIVEGAGTEASLLRQKYQWLPKRHFLAFYS